MVRPYVLRGMKGRAFGKKRHQIQVFFTKSFFLQRHLIVILYLCNYLLLPSSLVLFSKFYGVSEPHPKKFFNFAQLVG